LRHWRRRLLLTVAVLLLVALFLPLLVPLPAAAGTVPPERLADPEGRFLDVKGWRVYAKAAGRGQPALLLLHGFGASLFSWQAVQPALASRGATLAYDRPAFGLSERPLPGQWVGDNPYGPGFQVELALAMLDQLGADRAVLVGHSAGGGIALQLALAHPERVRALILVAPALGGGYGLADWQRSLLSTTQARWYGPLALRWLMPEQGLQVVRRAWHDPQRLPAATVEGYTLPLRVENWDRAIWEYTLAGGASVPRERLKGLDLPVLVITGDDDRIVPTTQSVRLTEEVPKARLVVVPECGHLPQEEKPREFLRAVDEFLATLT
jgi:pimeloyl-ACP methyl ester carboxylesterase